MGKQEKRGRENREEVDRDEGGREEKKWSDFSGLHALLDLSSL